MHHRQHRWACVLISLKIKISTQILPHVGTNALPSLLGTEQTGDRPSIINGSTTAPDLADVTNFRDALQTTMSAPLEMQCTTGVLP